MKRKALRYISYKKYSDTDFEVTSKVIFPPKTTPDTSRKDVHTIHSATVSVQRAHKCLYDVLRANQWKYFITLTFGDPDRIDDQYCRDQFSKWRKQMRESFPSMYYVAVPEYHERGSIHYHIVVGGVTGAYLGLVDSGRVLHFGKAWLRQDFIDRGFAFDEKIGEGATIYNVGAWKCGFSTATEIRSSAAVSNYVSKYLTKNDIDPRFFNKRRFYTSHNCNRPQVVKDCVEAHFNGVSDVLTEFASKCYSKPSIYYDKYDCAEDVVKARLRGDLPMPKHHLPFDT